MIVGKMIEITKESEEYLNNVFDIYQEEHLITDDIKGRCIIHLYPMEDTYDKNGNLNGYMDAILFEAYIFDVDKKRYCRISNRDSIYCEVPHETRIFKDLSTMLIIDGGVKLRYHKTLEVYKLD